PKQTLPCALHESAFGGKADMTVWGSPLSRSLLGVKQTSSVAPHMSASDPKRTCARRLSRPKTTPSNLDSPCTGPQEQLGRLKDRARAVRAFKTTKNAWTRAKH